MPARTTAGKDCAIQSLFPFGQKYAESRRSAVRTAESAASRAKETPRPALGLHVVVELELLAVAAVPATMPLSWESIGRWFASFGGVDRCQPEQGRNRRTGFDFRHVADRGDGLVLVVDGSDWRSSRCELAAQWSMAVVAAGHQVTMWLVIGGGSAGSSNAPRLGQGRLGSTCTSCRGAH